MSHAQRRVSARLWAVLLASLLAVFGAVALVQPAHATDEEGEGKLHEGYVEHGNNVDLIYEKDGKEHRGNFSTGLYALDLGGEGGVLKTYCIDFGHPANKDTAYEEVGWDESGLEPADAQKINWILRNSYPFKDGLEDLAGKLELEQLDAKEAIAGTQAAIWHYSDGVRLDLDEEESETVKRIYDYLTGAANTGEDEPTASLDLVADNTSGHDGEKIGPYTVKTVAGEVSVKLADEADGVTLVGKDGAALPEKVPGGTEFFVDVAKGTAPGEATIKADAKAPVAIGRIFVGKGEARDKTQMMIVADSEESCLKAAEKATWTEGETPLPGPGAKAAMSCKKGGLVVKLTNKGEAPSPFTVTGEGFEKEVTVEAGKSEKVLVPVKEDAEYKVTVAGPGGFSEEFTGKRDCEAAPTPTPTPSPGPGQPAPTPDLPETGAGNLMVQLGIAALLLALGGGLLYFFRRRSSQQAEAAGADQ